MCCIDYLSTSVARIMNKYVKWTSLIAVMLVYLNYLPVPAVNGASSVTSMSTPVFPTLSTTPSAGNASYVDVTISSSQADVPKTQHGVNASASTTKSAKGDVSDPTPTQPSSSSKFIVGIAAGFGFTFGLIVAVCIVWRCCCKMMRGEDKKTSNKVAPGFDLPGRPPLAGGGGGGGGGSNTASSYAVQQRDDEEDGVSRDQEGGFKPMHLEIE